jgi:hypothetical protein
MSDGGRGVESAATSAGHQQERARESGRFFVAAVFACGRDDRSHVDFRPALAIASMSRQQEPRDSA